MRSSPTRGAAFALTLFFLVALPAGSVLALDAQDIRNLHAAGLDGGTIVNVIRGTTEPLEVTAEDVAAMEAEAFPAEIIAELRLQLGLGSPTVEEPTAPTLSDELEEQRRLEAERQRLEQERLDAERTQMVQEIETERARGSEVQTEFEGLRRAERLAEEGDYFAAAAVYNRFLEEVAPDPTTNEYYEAKFGLVSSLHRAGLRDAIRADALEVALMGVGRRHFEDAIVILRDVVSDTGFNSPRIADLSNQVVADRSQEFQDLFNYFLGRYYYDAGQLQQAVSYLTTVDLQGEYGARAAFLASVAMINPELGENVRAVESLQRAITVADPEEHPEDQEVMENAYLALARIAYQIGNFGGALYYYHKIPQDSSRWTTALFESAWTYFLSGDFNRALGRFQALGSPYHNHRFYPDLYVLEAAAYLFSCNIDEAYDSVAAFEERIGGLRELLRQFISEATDPMAFFNAVMDPEGAAEQGNPTLPPEAMAVVLADADFNRLYRITQQLEDEIDLFEAEASAFGERGELTLELLRGDLNNRQLETAVLVHDIARDFLAELDDWWFRAQEVTIEIQDLERRYLERILSGGMDAIQEGTTFFVVADDWQFWPWEGEYWLDEVGYYRGNLTERCPDDIEF